MVDAGLALTLAPVVALRFVLGDQLYVVAPLAVNVVELPGHIVGGADKLTVGVVFTVTTTVAGELGQPVVVPITLYVIVEFGLAFTLAPVVALRFVFGDQAYVVAPLAVNVVELPEQIVGGADNDTVGVVFTVTTTVAGALGQPAVVPVTE